MNGSVVVALSVATFVISIISYVVTLRSHIERLEAEVLRNRGEFRAFQAATYSGLAMGGVQVSMRPGGGFAVGYIADEEDDSDEEEDDEEEDDEGGNDAA